MTKIINRFRDLFEGMTEAYGYYNVAPGKAGEKLLGERDTRRENVTTELWERHLDGEQGLGIIPIRADNMCKWGCIDIDKYDFQHKPLIQKITSSKLPLVVCRSKSGGAHVFLFTKEPVAAKLMQSKLKGLASALGYGKSEIFPKQTQVFVERGDLGSWLNLPYFECTNTMRYGFSDKGVALSIEDFLDFAESKRLSEKELTELTQALSTEEELPGAPPCLQHLVTQGFPEGMRNNGLMALAVYAKKSNPDSWQKVLEEYNQKYMDPPLGSDEVSGVIRSMERKEYGYKCNDLPISSFCNAGLCRTRQYGVGNAAAHPNFGSLTKLDTMPPTWFLDVEDTRMELETEDLQNPLKFQKKCMEQLNKMPPRMDGNAWQQLISHLMESVMVLPAPSEASAEGYFQELLHIFCCSDRSKARSKEEILTGKPWRDPETGVALFRLTDLMEYLSRQKFKDLSRQQIASKLKKFGAEHTQAKIKGQCVRLFSLKFVEEPREPLTVPPMPKEVF